MFTLTEEQRKQLLQYMWSRPYGEVATHIAMLASLKPNNLSTKKFSFITFSLYLGNFSFFCSS